MFLFDQNEINETVCDNSKVLDEFNLNPKIDLQEGIENMYS